MEGLTGAFSFCFVVIRRAQLKSASMRRDFALVQRNTVMHVPLLGAPGEAEAADGRVHRRQQRINSDIPRQLRPHRVGRAAPHSALHVLKRGARCLLGRSGVFGKQVGVGVGPFLSLRCQRSGVTSAGLFLELLDTSGR